MGQVQGKVVLITGAAGGNCGGDCAALCRGRRKVGFGG